MAARIGEILLQKQLITPKQLDDALKAQMIYGGRLGTNLVELGYVEPKVLAATLSEQRHVPVATEADFESVSPQTLELIAADVAAKFVAFPLLRDGPRRLRVAMLNPYGIEDVDQLGFITGMRIVPYIAPELQLYFYLERYYGITRDARYIRLAPDPSHAAAHAHAPRPAPAATAKPDSPFGSFGNGYLSDDSDEDGLGGAPVSAANAAAHLANVAARNVAGAPAPAAVPPRVAPPVLTAPSRPAPGAIPAVTAPQQMGPPVLSSAPRPVTGSFPAVAAPQQAPPVLGAAPRPVTGSFPAVAAPQQVPPPVLGAAPRPATGSFPADAAAPRRPAPVAQPVAPPQMPQSRMASGSFPAVPAPQQVGVPPASAGPSAPQPTPAPQSAHGRPQAPTPTPTPTPTPAAGIALQQLPPLGSVLPERAAPHVSPAPEAPPPSAAPARPHRHAIELDAVTETNLEVAAPWEFATWERQDASSNDTVETGGDSEAIQLADPWEYVHWSPPSAAPAPAPVVADPSTVAASEPPAPLPETVAESSPPDRLGAPAATAEDAGITAHETALAAVEPPESAEAEQPSRTELRARQTLDGSPIPAASGADAGEWAVQVAADDPQPIVTLTDVELAAESSQPSNEVSRANAAVVEPEVTAPPVEVKSEDAQSIVAVAEPEVTASAIEVESRDPHSIVVVAEPEVTAQVIETLHEEPASTVALAQLELTDQTDPAKSDDAPLIADGADMATTEPAPAVGDTVAVDGTVQPSAEHAEPIAAIVEAQSIALAASESSAQSTTVTTEAPEPLITLLENAEDTAGADGAMSLESPSVGPDVVHRSSLPASTASVAAPAAPVAGPTVSTEPAQPVPEEVSWFTGS